MSDFNYCPATGATKDITPRVRSSVFGDGYQQRVADGINTITRKWMVTFTRKEADIDLIEDFLISRAGVESFTWTPPEGIEGRFICKSWARNLPAIAAQSISCTFEEVFGED
jgi:phage-related protein